VAAEPDTTSLTRGDHALIEEHVRGLDVSVHESTLVCGVERSCNL
jgi:hypothetical protein